MSQAPRPARDDDTQPLSPDSGGPLTRAPPTARETVRPHPIDHTRGLLPRDHISQRSDGHLYRSHNPNAAGGPKPAPSPLHTSLLSHTQGRDLSASPLGRTRPNLAVSSSTLERAFVEKASRENTESPGGGRPSLSPATESIGKSSRDSEIEHEMNLSKRDVNGEARKMPSTFGLAQSSASPPHSPIPSPPHNVVERIGHRTIPRTSSIDSAISSISSASHSQKSSFDSNSLTPADINNLIAAAGSAEAVIVHLLKDKHHAAVQNDQLWRLLEKQRALVFGLNKDLERALKDKEKYRKKLKELQSLTPLLPANVQAPTERSSIANYNSSSDVQPDTSLFVNDGVSLNDPRQPPQVASSDGSSATVERHGQGPSSVPVSLPASTARPDLNVRSSDGLPIQSHAMDLGLGSPLADNVSRGRVTTVHSSKLANLGEKGQESNLLRSEALVEATVDLQRTEDTSKMPPPSRKPPPAPLNLDEIQRKSSPINPISFHDSESDYDDVGDVDEIPTQGRGRRRTREADDKEREAAVIRDQEARSRSEKMSKPGPIGGDGEDSAAQKVPLGLPSSPRKLVAQSLGQLEPGQFSATESLAAVINNSQSVSTSLGERLGMSPPITPGLPVSPRPGDRPLGSPLPRLPKDGSGVIVSPPVSPRSTVAGLPSSPRVTKQGMPASPRLPSEAAASSLPSIDASVKIDSPKSPYGFDRSIYQGLVSDEYPGLLLPPNALPSIEVKVSSSRLRPSRNSYIGGKASDEEPVFTLSVFSRSNRSELWRVEKVILALPQLDQQVRQLSDFSAKLPDRAIFSGHSPAKVDARRDALNAYFEILLDTPMTESAALVICRFLSSDAIEPRDDETNLLKANGKLTPELVRGPDGKLRKEGYLTKRGKNFGGWKARYFVLHGSELKYFESPGGPHLGTIKIQNAQIGKQAQNGQNQSPPRADDDSDNQYRHAFLILEPKKKDSSALVRHVLCAESDKERDAWVDALLQYVESPSSEEERSNVGVFKAQSQMKQHPASNPKSRLFRTGSSKGSKGTDSPDPDAQDTVQGFSYDDAKAAEPPVHGSSYEHDGMRASPTPFGSGENTHLNHSSTTDSVVPGSHSSKMISGPTNGAIIQDVGAWGNKMVTSTKEKKRSIWGFRARSSSDLASQTQGMYESNNANNNSSTERRDFVQPVFGLPLADAVQFCGPRGVDVDLPAVAYRCIEYLQAKGAASEEGIFRLSGSNVVIKALKERFNTEGDVDFLAGDHYYDVHAVASLFKQYLRELPTTVLTRELHLDFLRVLGALSTSRFLGCAHANFELELEDKEKKIAAFNTLVHLLPRPNLTLLGALSRFLIEIVSNSDINKMTVRNVGIVFAPTLNIPAPVFSMFLTDYDRIFSDNSDSTKNVELSINPTLTSEDIRSPRHQIFSDIPTPGFNQTSFYMADDVGTPAPHDIRATYDSGFIPMVPTYDQAHSGLDQQPRHGERSRPGPRMLSPNGDQLRSAKAKRRESSLLFMDLGSRKGSLPQLRDDQGMGSISKDKR
jgi:RalA-binding protein 1